MHVLFGNLSLERAIYVFRSVLSECCWHHQKEGRIIQISWGVDCLINNLHHISSHPHFIATPRVAPRSNSMNSWHSTWILQVRNTQGLWTWFWILIPCIVANLVSACAKCHSKGKVTFLWELANKVSLSDTWEVKQLVVRGPGDGSSRLCESIYDFPESVWREGELFSTMHTLP